MNRRAKKLDGEGEAHLIALACAEPPEGRVSWTLQLVADGLVEREVVESISYETVCRMLKKRSQAPVLQRGRLWLNECWCLPPQGSAEFVWAMEDVLEVYHGPYAKNELLACLEETRKQLVKETRQTCPVQPGTDGIYDYEYQRNGLSNLFILLAPLEGWHRVEVRERRTRSYWAQVVRQLVDEDYSEKERIVLVIDNLNTHHPASWYEAFEPAEARRIAQ